MHALHKVLVKVDQKSRDREEMVETARQDAEDLTKGFYDRAFDWRETDTAGRWSEEYPENVLLSKDGLDRFIKELEETRKYQRDQIALCMERVAEVSTDLKTLVENNIDKIQNFGALFEVKLIAELLSGDYVFDSGFFDGNWYSAKVTDETIERVKEEPDDWALVMFDYHI